jgi:hypothetical protein
MRFHFHLRDRSATSKWILILNILNHGLVFDALSIKDALKFIPDYFFRRPHIYTLSDLDPLFVNTISKLPVKSQKGYCQRLIERSRFDLERTNKKERAERLEKLIKAAEIQLLELSS